MSLNKYLANGVREMRMRRLQASQMQGGAMAHLVSQQLRAKLSEDAVKHDQQLPRFRFEDYKNTRITYPKVS
jgi:hypothetical protein